jgi:glutathione peroxidase
MKKLTLLIMALFSFYTSNSQETVYDIKINDIEENPIDLEQFKGRYILFVNVASECGFTPQYEDLERLQQNYKDNLIIIGLPCNQFGGQEPGNAKEIQQFCRKNYGVSFLLTEKVEVKGRGKHSLYSWLTDKKLNGKYSSSVRWNFQKYIVSPKGELVDYFYSTTKPMSQKITSILKQ